MGGAVRTVTQAATNVVNSTVNTVKDAVKTVGDKPLEGIAKVAELPLSVPLAQVSSAAPATAKIPVVGDLTKGAQGANNILTSVEGGSLPRITDVKDAAIAGGEIAGAGFLGLGAVPGAIVGDSATKAIFTANAGQFAGAALGAYGGEDGFDFSTFLDGLGNSGGSPAPGRPTQTVTVHQPVLVGGGSSGWADSGSGLDLTTVAILAGLALGSLLILKGRKYGL